MENTSQNLEEARLEELKNEILEEVKPKKKEIHWGSAAITVVLVLLALVSALQMFQSVKILGKIKSGAISPAGAASTSNVQELPDMVGGC